MKLIKTLIISTLALVALSCNGIMGIQGNGIVKSKEISPLSDFNEIRTSRGLNVVLIPGTENKALIEADENLLDIIKVSVENNKLHVTSEEQIHKAASKKVLVTFTSLQKIEVDSGCHVSSRGEIKNKDLNVSIHSGAYAKLSTKSDAINCEVHSGSTLEIDGFTNTSKMQAHSGATLNAKNLKSKNTNAEAHSGATLNVFVSEVLKAEAHSGASLGYAGNPSSVSKSSHSGGRISKI